MMPDDHKHCVQPILNFNGSQISVGEHTWTVPYPIRDARRIGSRIVVIYDDMSCPKDTAFHNVEAFDDTGRKLWTIENPGAGPAVSYVQFTSEDPLVIWNFACFQCTIDPETGRLLRARFTK